MSLVTLDVVLTLPDPLRELAIASSEMLAMAMEDRGGACFRLGGEFPGQADGPCEPHVSVFMMAVEESEVSGVGSALVDVARSVGPVAAEATDYRHNHEGAPEVFFAQSDGFRTLQRAVITLVEPLRCGRLREFGPGGERLTDVVDDPAPKDPTRVLQLRRYGFDDVSDDDDDRFHPHVTLTWPRDETSRIDLNTMPPVEEFSGVLTDLGLYGMSPNGTCTTRYGTWTLTGAQR